MQAGTPAESRRVAEVLRQKDGSAFADIMAIVHKTGGIEATREAALNHQQQATAALAALTDSDALAALRLMAEKAVDRQG